MLRIFTGLGLISELRSGVVLETTWRKLDGGGWGAQLEVDVVESERLQQLGLQVEWEACTEGRCVPKERATLHIPVIVTEDAGVERYPELWNVE